MHVDTDAVAGAVGKISALPAGFQEVARNSVNIACRAAGLQGLNCKVMGLFDKRVEFFLPGTGFADDKRAGFIRTVALIPRAVVDRHKIPG